MEGDDKGITFLKLEGTWLALNPIEKLDEDTTIASTPRSGKPRFTLAHNVESEAKVDEVLTFVEKAGAKIIKPASKTFWGGYSGYFADPDGFYWEVAYNPFTDLS